MKKKIKINHQLQRGLSLVLCRSFQLINLLISGGSGSCARSCDTQKKLLCFIIWSTWKCCIQNNTPGQQIHRIQMSAAYVSPIIPSPIQNCDLRFRHRFLNEDILRPLLIRILEVFCFHLVNVSPNLWRCIRAKIPEVLHQRFRR